MVWQAKNLAFDREVFIDNIGDLTWGYFVSLAYLLHL
ncbi:hypothetical protein swp_0471 [Shewanella piezotolerans WP3]|uniref:Uncharacterized protein n=1 Tax=Shewanella piezotolerans (strain WP3 / JCM 13877) TaxID=225849 RepID=B8CI26_SHEPW|nr:hypothetical protein swp_0471 [Shewanella piezotolerans WP3]